MTGARSNGHGQGGRRTDPVGTAGSRAMARRTSRPGPWRDAKRRRLGRNTPATPGGEPGTRGQRVAPKPACGRRRERHAAAAASGGKRKVRQGQLAACLRIRGVSESRRRIAHHNLATPRPPRIRGARRHPDASPAAAVVGRAPVNGLAGLRRTLPCSGSRALTTTKSVALQKLPLRPGSGRSRDPVCFRATGPGAAQKKGHREREAETHSGEADVPMSPWQLRKQRIVAGADLPEPPGTDARCFAP